jgi:beta-glucosidase
MTLLDHTLSEADGVATVHVANTGTRAGSTVVQIYAANLDSHPPVPQLVGFRRVELPAGESVTIDVRLDLTPTMERNNGTWSRRPGKWQIMAAPHSPQA